MSDDKLSKPGYNCWRADKATHATLIVDYANYYRALHQAICRARHSVFIIGWDIDSRIELVRGEDAAIVTGDCPTTLFELIKWKALQNPDIHIYLNKWNYSYFFASQREFFAGLKWHWRSPPNVHYIVDSYIPFAACHHQKIVVVDDEIAFSGGMDIAAARWDRRGHHPVNRDRRDLEGLFPDKKTPFAPYHDVQILVAGPAARSLGEWARLRWRKAGQKDVIPMRADESENPPQCWPQGIAPDFHDVDVAIARTLPAMKREAPVSEIENILLEEIARAENFIYMENQFFTSEKIARALNDRMRQKPKLRMLGISCDRPKGVMEKKSMWTGRVIFRDILQSGGVGGRAVLAYPFSREGGREEPVCIHSKLTIIDDRYLHVGSANINNRSMGFDTECDLIVEGRDRTARNRIAALRTDLIREHTGQEASAIEKTIANGADAEWFLNYLSTSRQHLRKIDDEKFRHERFAALGRFIADPGQPFIAGKKVVPVAITLIAVVVLLLAWKFSPLSVYTTPEKIVPLLKHLRSSIWLVPLMLAIYILAGIILFPVMILDISTILAFGLPWGPLLALMGASSSAAIGFGMGWLVSRKKPGITGKASSEIGRYLKNINIVGMALLRMLPVAPFSVMNFTVGVAEVPFPIFLFGSWLGLLPGLCIMSLLRGPVLQILHHPNPLHILALAGGIGVWGLMLYFANKYGRRWQSQKREQSPA